MYNVMQNSVGIWEQSGPTYTRQMTRRQIYPEQCIRTELENVTLVNWSYTSSYFSHYDEVRKLFTTKC